MSSRYLIAVRLIPAIFGKTISVYATDVHRSTTQGVTDQLPFANTSDNTGRVSAGGFVKLPSYIKPAAAPSPGPAGHEQPSGSGLLPPSQSYPDPTPGTGFTGTTQQAATAATIAGLAPNSPEWVGAVQQANANGGVTPGTQQTPANAPYLTDPGYQAALAQQQLGLAQQDAATKSARERAIVDFGDPAMAAMAGFGLDPQAAAFAKQNYVSGNAQLARLDKNHDLMRQAVINRLASHGLLASGDLGYGEGQADTQFGQDVYDARGKLLDYLNNLSAQDLATRNGLHSSVVTALSTAFQNFMEHPEWYAASGETDPVVPPPKKKSTVPGPPAYPDNAATIIARALQGRGL